jgi:Rrf2 family protein
VRPSAGSDAVISQTVEYALRAVVYLAHQAPATQTTDQIAEATRVPKPYLSKVIQGLVRADILKSRRGVGGGVTIAKSPDRLTVLEVVNAVDPVPRIHECPLGLKSHGIRLCPLHRRLDDALQVMEQAFSQTTLADILAEPTSSPPLCEVTPRVRLH